MEVVKVDFLPRVQGLRLSLSMEFQNAALSLLCEPLRDPHRPPVPGERLATAIPLWAF